MAGRWRWFENAEVCPAGIEGADQVADFRVTDVVGVRVEMVLVITSARTTRLSCPAQGPLYSTQARTTLEPVSPTPPPNMDFTSRSNHHHSTHDEANKPPAPLLKSLIDIANLLSPKSTTPTNNQTRSGHDPGTALVIPKPPSHTTTSGAAIRLNNACQAAAFSLRATCQPNT